MEVLFPILAAPAAGAKWEIEGVDSVAKLLVILPVPAIEQGLFSNVSVSKARDFPLLLIQIGVGIVQQLHAGYNVAIPANEDAAAADEWTHMLFGKCSGRRIAPHLSDCNIRAVIQKLLLRDRTARNLMTDVDLIHAIFFRESIDMLQLFDVFRRDNEGDT